MSAVAPAPKRPLLQDKPMLLLIGGAVIGTLPLLFVHLLYMWKRPQYQYFPVVLGVIGWLMWRDCKREDPPAPSPLAVPFGISLLMAALAAAAVGAWLVSPWVGAAGAVMAFGGILFVARDRIPVQNPVGVWCLSLLILRPPLGYDNQLAFWLQGVTSKIAGAMLDIARVANLVEGNTIVLRDRHLFVEEACSGIVSLLSIIACCAILAVWQNRPAPHAILLTVSGTLWAAILNVFRITILAIGLDRLGIDLSEGWKHEALGLVLFSGTLALSFCTDRLLLFLLSPIASPENQVYGQYSQDTEGPPLLTRFFNTLVEPATLLRNRSLEGQPTKPRRITIPQWLPILGILFAVVGVTQAIMAGTSSGTFQKAQATPAFLQLAENNMPEQLVTAEGTKLVRGEFTEQKRNVGDILGEYSRQWKYSGRKFAMLNSVDFVFRDFHELTECYEGLGWNKATRKIITRQDRGDKFVEATFTKETGERAYLVFGSFNQAGENVIPPDAGLGSGIQARLFKADQGVPGGVYQTQALTVSRNELTNEDREAIRSAYFQFYDRMTDVAKGSK